MDSDRVSRRQVLGVGGGLLAGLSGCLDRFDGGGPRTDDGTPGTDGTPRTDDGTSTDDGSAGTDDGGTADGDGTPAVSIEDVELSGELVADGFTSPVAVVPMPGGDFLIADQVGTIYRVDGAGTTEQFLDVTDRMVSLSGYTEQGLLGFALHPDFEHNGRCFVRYSAPSSSGSHTFVLSEFSVDGGGVADPGSERPILEIPEPQSNHNGGAIAFGPDGYLYVGVGDGGGAGDQGSGHVTDWYGGVDGGNGQNVTQNLLGGILRIDVDGQSGDLAYAIPSDNPLVGRSGLDEYYAWGFRNPWRLSFGPEGRLFAADVGQNEFEEVDVVEKGGNYGWNVREGDSCFSTADCPSETTDGAPLLDPIISYPHSGADVSGISVIGGYLYDGAAMPDLVGTYVFADWQSGGQLFVGIEPDEGPWPVETVPVTGVGTNVLSFGRDLDGEILVCTSNEAGVTGSSGAVHRLSQA